ncbi:PilZ domain-containing protein [Sphingomonas sp. KR1UV-12]|uniref:PilZ domain-containing protein n=1 Tax=Sphingomonas aurea TaxID=3063994 RepID=A0ABT9EMM4_9SPHN|nr:PilZ domain-containing protein [Sphingomonas sp. KR1UV-12]MDP1028072.1 PilZ domain-containing protein [Sphingomonas sp. KR1UV-12]
MALTAQLFRADDERASDRQSVNLDGTLRQQDDHRPLDVMIEDLSTTGFRMSCSEPLTLDSTVTIGIAGLGRHTARVVRSAAPYYGCRFVVPVDISGADAIPSSGNIVAADFGRGSPAAFFTQEDVPLDAVELRIRQFRGPIIVAGLLVPWVIAGAACAALL